MKRDIDEGGTLARDDSPDDITRNQVTRSQSLALQLVRMLNECGDLNAVPCRNWSAVDRQTVEQLAELQAIFARIGDGVCDEQSTGRERANGSEYSPWIDSPKMIEMMKANGIRGTSDAGIKRTKKTWQAEAQTGSNNQRFRLKLSTLDELGIKYPAEWNTSEA